MYAHDTSSSRKSCLKLYQAYLNMANSRLRECRIKFTDKMLCVQKLKSENVSYIRTKPILN